MVTQTAKRPQKLSLQLETYIVDLPEEELRWCSVQLNDIYDKGLRLEASIYDIEGKHAREAVSKCVWGYCPLCGEGGLATAFYGPRFKRIKVEKSAYPMYLPSQIVELNPKPSGYLSELTKVNLDSLRVKEGQILLTRSGTIGNCTLVSKTIQNRIFSDDVIRVTCHEKQKAGYIYIFLRTKVGNALLRTNKYGSVVSHIEPEHLEKIIVPNCPLSIMRNISELAFKSFSLRDDSNKILDKAKNLLRSALDMVPLEQLKAKYFDNSCDIRNYSIKLSNLDNRLDASFHVPIVNKIISHLKREAKEITTVSDPSISSRIILPGRFKRIYVEEGQGTVFFGGKQLYELDPSNKKFLSLGHHGDRIQKELRLEENMIMVTCSGTIGKVTLVPKHWSEWTANQHIIRIVSANPSVAGYIYTFLATEYGKELIAKFTYGSVVDEIDANQASKIPIPLLKDAKLQRKINDLALLANDRLYEAYQCEQKAINLMNEEVIHR